MNRVLKNLMPDPLPGTATGLINALREMMQSVALLGLWRARFFEHAAFYGGTSLRLIYGLDRYSEDLDFSLLKPAENFNLDKYSPWLLREFEAYGIKVLYEPKQKLVNTKIESAFLKANSYAHLAQLGFPDRILSEINKHAVLKVKLEVDINPPSGFETDIKYIFSPVQFGVKTYSLPSLFAGKMHAVLCRKWKTRVKGRDWYDFVWYASHHPMLKLSHLEERMRQSGHYIEEKALTREIFLALLDQAVGNLNIESVKKEVTPFVNDIRMLELWSHDFFRAAAERIVFV